MFKLNQALLTSYKLTFLVYFIFFAVVSSHFLLGDVVAPTRQETDIGIPAKNSPNLPIENPKFNDFPHSYIPAISEHLIGPRSGWLATWTNNNEAGRPTFHLGGFSSAYPLTWFITLFTQNPWYLITVFSLLSCFLAGIFIILLCKELNLVALAALVASTSFATSPFFMYWLTFPMYITAFCWSAGAMWALTRLVKKPSIFIWSVLAFCIYSLLMTASPQAVVYRAYFVCGFGMYLVYRLATNNRLGLLKFIGLTSSAIIVGAALAIPVYLDLAFANSESARIAADISFFTFVLPNLSNFTELVRFFVLGTVPELFGRPISPLFPLAYNGQSVTLIVIFFSVVSVLTRFKSTWGWWLAIAVLCLMAFIEPIFVFCVEYLGFNLSRNSPLGSILLPATLIVAYGVDALVKLDNTRLRLPIVIAASLTIVGIISIGLSYGLYQEIPISRRVLLALLCTTVLLALQYHKTRPTLLLLGLAIVVLTTSRPLILHQAPANIASDSTLVAMVRKNLPAGSRFAVASPALSVLHPNLNASFGLTSIHSYNSLSSTRYHRLINELGGEVITFGRWNNHIAPDYSSTAFWMSNISLMLSANQITHPNLELIGQESGVNLYRVVSTMGDSLQMVASLVDQNLDKISIKDPRLLSTYTPSKTVDKGDWLEYKIASIQPSVLVLSQKFHRDWTAEVLTPNGWRVAKVTEVNGVFQGVFLPAETSQVRLNFKPYSRYIWVGHFFWLFLILFLATKYINYCLKKIK